MTDILNLFDQYNRRARLFPALLALLPPLLMLVTWFPALLTDISGKSFLVLFASMGGLYLLASLSRSAGRKAEKRLLEDWGGWPTTQWLRHRDSHLNATTKARYHDFLRRNVPGIELPTVDDENANPAHADSIYASAIEWLKEKRRGDEYRMVLNENIEYGFRRNMRGLRWFAVGASLAVSIATLGAAISRLSAVKASLFGMPLGEQLGYIFGALPFSVAVALTVNLAALLFWLFLVRDSWVREAGDHYARALLATCE